MLYVYTLIYVYILISYIHQYKLYLSFAKRLAFPVRTLKDCFFCQKDFTSLFTEDRTDPKGVSGPQKREPEDISYTKCRPEPPV